MQAHMFLLPGYNYTGYLLRRPQTVWMHIFKDNMDPKQGQFCTQI